MEEERWEERWERWESWEDGKLGKVRTHGREKHNGGEKMDGKV